jgi:hypothetical protein
MEVPFSCDFSESVLSYNHLKRIREAKTVNMARKPFKKALKRFATSRFYPSLMVSMGRILQRNGALLVVGDSN